MEGYYRYNLGDRFANYQPSLQLLLGTVRVSLTLNGISFLWKH